MRKKNPQLLYHFIGKNKDDDDKRYGLLIDILKCGFLQPNRSGENVYFYEPNGLIEPMRLDERFPVCFIDRDWCDNIAFKKHMKRYSKFAIGFEKQFILDQGGNPVFYYFDSSSPTSCGLRNSIGVMKKHFERLEKQSAEDDLELNEVVGAKLAFKNIEHFIKPFNFDEVNRDKDVYDEREWRIIATDGEKAKPFWAFRETPAIKGIKCAVKEVIVPNAYYRRAKNDINKLIPVGIMPNIVIAENIGTFFEMIKHIFNKISKIVPGTLPIGKVSPRGT